MKKPTNKMFILMGFIVIIAAILVIVFTNKPSGATSLPMTVSVTDAADQFKNGAYMLDVREPSEWEAGHVEGAVLLPLGQLQSRINEIPTNQDVLIICRSGNRSGQARDILRAAGLERTTSVDGGMNAWAAAGLPVVTGN